MCVRTSVFSLELAIHWRNEFLEILRKVFRNSEFSEFLRSYCKEFRISLLLLNGICQFVPVFIQFD
jgi:hypothetical protein